MIKLTYIWHDCFVFESSRLAIIFDYWKDVTSAPHTVPDFIKHIEKTKRVYVVVSHHHKDHYTKEIFDWSKIIPDIKYILSKDVAKYARHILRKDSIYKGTKPSPDSVTVLGPGDTYADEYISIKAYGSTDIGNSYVVAAETDTLFHAGDLNAWIWKDESTEEEIRAALSGFEAILTTIAEDYPAIDIAMFPVDSRIGSGYYTGAKIFVRKINVKHFFPMHFGLGNTKEEQQKYQRDAADIDKYANKERGEYICLQSPYAVFAKSPTHTNQELQAPACELPLEHLSHNPDKT